MNPQKSIKIKSYPKKTAAKHLSRIIAIQALYAFEMQPAENFKRVIKDVVEANGITSDQQKIFDLSLLQLLTQNLIESIEAIDQQIALYLNIEWRVERLPKLLRNILRIGAYELKYNTTVSSAVIIDEYIEIAKFFHHDGERGFVNSILDKLSKDTQWIS